MYHTFRWTLKERVYEPDVQSAPIAHALWLQALAPRCKAQPLVKDLQGLSGNTEEAELDALCLPRLQSPPASRYYFSLIVA